MLLLQDANKVSQHTWISMSQNQQRWQECAK